MVGVEQWAEIRRLVLVEQRSQRQVAKSLGLARDTVARAVASDSPPKYERAVVVSKLDPFKEWICEQLRDDPSIQSLRLREMAGEMGYAGGKSIFDDYVREVRPRFQVRRTFQRTIYRPGELVQCDLWEPRELIPVGHGQQRCFEDRRGGCDCNIDHSQAVLLPVYPWTEVTPLASRPAASSCRRAMWFSPPAAQVFSPLVATDLPSDLSWTASTLSVSGISSPASGARRPGGRR